MTRLSEHTWSARTSAWFDGIFPNRFARAKSLRALLLSIGAVVLCTLAAFPFRGQADYLNVVMIYMVGVVVVAARAGTLHSIITSLLSVGAFNFFFTQPYHTFHVYETRYYLTFAVMLMTCLVIGSLASRLREQVRRAQEKERDLALLYSFAGDLLAASREDEIAERSGNYIEKALKAQVTIWLLEESGTVFSCVFGKTPFSGMAARAFQALANMQALEEDEVILLPLLTGEEKIGVMAVRYRGEDEIKASKRPLLEAFVTILSSSLQRARKSEEAERSRVEAESEKTRNLLLSSVSHDLRTPLASLSGMAGSLLVMKKRLPGDVVETLKAIHDQTDRLSKMVSNLLDMTRLEAAEPELNKQPYFLEEVIGSALSGIEPFLGNRTVTTSLGEQESLIELDGHLVEQLFANLLENAVKFTADDGKIHIQADFEDKEVTVSVKDDGEGVAPGEEKKIFQKFYKSLAGRGGSGLGLTISKAIVSIHGGRIWAEHNKGGGMVFTFTLPHEKNGEQKRAGRKTQ